MTTVPLSPPVGGGDPVALVVAYLRDSAVLVGLDVSGVNEPPYPRAVVTDPPGPPLRQARHLLSTTVQVEVLDDLYDSTGAAALKGWAYLVVDALRDLPDREYPAGPVVTDVEFGALGWSPLPTGQGRYLFRATVTSHP